MRRNVKKALSLLLCVLMLLGSAASAMAAGAIERTTSVAWDGAYDVVVIGFGGAGAVAAKNAADAGAKVLIVEKAPEGHEGGNTRYAGQLFVYGNGNYENTLTYYRALAGDHQVPDAMIELYAGKIAVMTDVVAEEFGLDKADFMDGKVLDPASFSGISPEYPELPGAESIELWVAHEGSSDAYLWQMMRKNVVDRAESIDVWFESPAVHLIQEPQTKTILGVQVERGGELLNIRANSGVVMATGGFENNAEMIATYLGLDKVAVQGSVYNTGDGVRMAIEVGADLWHMHVYEGMGGSLGATSVLTGENEQVSMYTSFMPPCYTGSAIMVAGDGSRFLDETEGPRHGHIKNGDAYVNPSFPQNMYLILSEENYLTALAYQVAIPADYEYTYSGATLEELAAAFGADASVLAATVEEFNAVAEGKQPDRFSRAPETMKAFPAEGPYYAVELCPVVLNTQGGARRNENAEVLDPEGNPIPHLYSAGEFGGICSVQYQGGGNIAECIIFGQIAGQNAAAAKEALPEGLVTDVEDGLVYVPGYESDIGGAALDVELGENEYLGVGEGGMGGSITVKVKIEDGEIKAIDVVKHSETAGISDPAFAQIPDAVIAAQSADVDTVTGCTMTSTALISAIRNAIDSAN